MQSESYFRVRLDDCSSGGLAALLWCFVMSVFMCAMIGEVAPAVFKTEGRSSQMACVTYDCKPTFFGYLNQLDKMHQMVFLEFTMNKPMEFGISAEQAREAEVKFRLELVVSAQGETVSSDGTTELQQLRTSQKTMRLMRCPAMLDQCDPVVLWAEPFLEYTGYHVEVKFVHPYETHGLLPLEYLRSNSTDGRMAEMHKKAVNDVRFIPQAVAGFFEMKYVNKAFTKFEFCTKYIFFGVTLIITAWYNNALRKRVAPKFRSYEQKWISVLLVSLCFFNDPFFFIEIFTASSFWTGLYVISEVTLLVLLLMFFLCVFDIVRSPSYQEGEGRDLSYTFYAPKLVLCVPIWLFTVLIYMFVRLQDQSDPMYNEPDDMTHFTFAKKGLEILMVLYVVYAGLLLLGTVYTTLVTETMPGKKYRYLFIITVLSLGMAIIGNIVGAFAPEIIEKVEFFLFFGAANMYIWLLAFAYFPSGTTHDSGKTSYDNKSSRSGSNSEHGGVSGPTRSQMKNPLQNQINHANSSGASASSFRMDKQPLPPKGQADSVAVAQAVQLESATM